MKPTYAIAVLLLLAGPLQAEPKAVVSVTTTANGLVLLDASKSVGELTWKIRGEHEILFGGKVAVCRVADFTGALAAVGPDGTVDLILLPVQGDTPPPAASLTDKVRKLARDLKLPPDERAIVATIHDELSAKAGKEILSSAVLFVYRRHLLTERLEATTPDDWDTFLNALGELLQEVDAHIPGDDGPASDFAEPFRQVAEGLK